MAFNVDALSAYTDEQRLPLITKAVFAARTAAKLQKQVGIKSAAALNLMDTNAPFQSGDACGWNASGTTTFTQRVITVGKIKVQESICPRTLENVWAQTQLQAGSNYDAMPFEQAFSEQKALKIAAQLETAIWQGDTVSSNTNINTNKFDGFLKLLNAASGTVVSGNVAGVSGSITTTNAIAIFDQIFTRIPVEIIDRTDLICFVGWDVFRTLLNALKAANYFHFAPEGADRGEFRYPGSNFTIYAVNGLNSTNRIVTTYEANMFYGTDLLSDEENFRIWHSIDNDEIRFQAAFKAGVQFAYPEFIVDWKLA